MSICERSLLSFNISGVDFTLEQNICYIVYKSHNKFDSWCELSIFLFYWDKTTLVSQDHYYGKYWDFWYIA